MYLSVLIQKWTVLTCLSKNPDIVKDHYTCNDNNHRLYTITGKFYMRTTGLKQSISALKIYIQYMGTEAGK